MESIHDAIKDIELEKEQAINVSLWWLINEVLYILHKLFGVWGVTPILFLVYYSPMANISQFFIAYIHQFMADML